MGGKGDCVYGMGVYSRDGIREYISRHFGIMAAGSMAASSESEIPFCMPCRMSVLLKGESGAFSKRADGLPSKGRPLEFEFESAGNKPSGDIRFLCCTYMVGQGLTGHFQTLVFRCQVL